MPEAADYVKKSFEDDGHQEGGEKSNANRTISCCVSKLSKENKSNEPEGRRPGPGKRSCSSRGSFTVSTTRAACRTQGDPGQETSYD